MPQPTLPQMLEDLEEARDNLVEYEDDIPCDSPTLTKLQAAVKSLAEIAKLAEDANGERCQDCGGNPCECVEDDEDDSDEG